MDFSKAVTPLSYLNSFTSPFKTRTLVSVDLCYNTSCPYCNVERQKCLCKNVAIFQMHVHGAGGYESFWTEFDGSLFDRTFPTHYCRDNHSDSSSNVSVDHIGSSCRQNSKNAPFGFIQTLPNMWLVPE